MSEIEEATPGPEYTEMRDPSPPPEEKTYEGNEPDALRDAAIDLDEARKREAAKAPRVTELDEPLQRKYYRTQDGKFTGEESPANETLSLKRASDDLTRVRAEEQAAIDASADARVAEVTDAIREELAPQQPQAEQPQQPPAASDEEEMQRALANPRIRQALESEVNKLEAQRSQYAQAAAQAFELSAAATFSQFPELAGVTQQTLQPVLAAVAQNNPARAQAIVSALQGTERLHQQSQQAQAAQAQIAATKQAIWFKAENDKFDSWAAANESKATMDEVMREGRRVLMETYNIDADGLGQMLRQNPGLRSAESQRLIFDSIKFKLAQEKIGAKRAPAPPVQRPGVSQPAPNYSDEEASGALARFNKNPTALHRKPVFDGAPCCSETIRKYQMNDPHPEIKRIMGVIGSDDRDDVDVVSVANFMTLGPADRAAVLANCDAIAGADDGVNLRQKAQVLDLTRAMRHADSALRRAGR